MRADKTGEQRQASCLTRWCHHVWQPPGNCRRPVTTAEVRVARRFVDRRAEESTQIAGHRMQLRPGKQTANRSLRAIDSLQALISEIVNLISVFA